MAHITKNFPEPTVETKKFWNHCKKQELLIQQCMACSHYQFYPRIICTTCMNRNVTWVRATGLGKIKMYTIIHRPISKAYSAPYAVALIQLAEGPMMMSNIINCDLDELAIGMGVKVAFEKWSEEITIPQFEPILTKDSLAEI